MDDYMSLSPTPAMFEAERVMLRGWQGQTKDGHPVNALVAMVSTDGPAPTVLTSIPPPMPDRSETFQTILGDMWQLVGRLTDDEAMDALNFIKSRALYRDPDSPERICDHCRQPYRGPAVFCSLQCALEAS